MWPQMLIFTIWAVYMQGWEAYNTFALVKIKITFISDLNKAYLFFYFLSNGVVLKSIFKCFNIPNMQLEVIIFVKSEKIQDLDRGLN